MEFFQSHSNMLPCISICFLIHFSSLFLPASSNYALPDHYFINCGSASSRSVYQRTFTGDQNPTNYVLSSKDTTSAEDDQTLSANQLYQSARIFRKSSSYELHLDQDGIYVVRLHFFPFPSLGNLADARFHVSASGFSLLSDFSGPYSFPLVEEFLIRVAAGKFKIEFEPAGKERSFAFINAIEVFLAPADFVQVAPAPPRVNLQGSDGRYKSVLDFPLHVVHRINVGGSIVKRETDTLMRYWIPDDAYLVHNNTASNKDYDGGINYQKDGQGATEFDAPHSVYNTAKEMKVDDGRTLDNFNISWRFEVGKGALHLVRLHFCDIVSRTTNENNRFNLFIYDGFREEVYPWGVISELAAPFYMDFVVDSDNSGFMNISVGAQPQLQFKTAFLNGVEIMELLGDKGAASGGGDSSRKRLFIIIGLCVGGVLLVAIVFGLLFLVLRKKKKKLKAVEALEWRLEPLYGGSNDSRTTVRTSVTGSPFADLNLGLKIPLSGILFATRKFDPNLMIGEGGFGKVYKGMLRNGKKVAIKRSEAGHGQGFEEFHTEILLLSKIRHHHLVSLIGYCDERDEMILVYEFMEMGTLREHLYRLQGESKRPVSTCELSWDQRLKMCIGAAKGLHYLHTGSAGTIIHRDIKSTNILLDENYVAKVADFGLSRSGPLDQTHVSTEVKGSFGYLDPEYFRCLQLTQKSDVYSFGVVLLEVLCARPAIDPLLPWEQVNLADWGMLWQRKGQLENVLDPFLVGNINPNSLRKFGETVEICLQECGADRPNMVDVLWDLEYCLQLQHSAVPREPYEDSTMEGSWGLGMSVVQRLPSQTFNGDEDESPHDSFTSTSVADLSQLNASEVFSQLNMEGAR